MVRNTTYYSVPRHIDLSKMNQLMKSSWLSLHSYNMYLHPTKCICWCCLIKSYPHVFCFYFQVGHEIMNELLVTTCIWNTKIRIHDYIQNGILHSILKLKQQFLIDVESAWSYLWQGVQNEIDIFLQPESKLKVYWSILRKQVKLYREEARVLWKLMLVPVKNQ